MSAIDHFSTFPRFVLVAPFALEWYTLNWSNKLQQLRQTLCRFVDRAHSHKLPRVPLCRVHVTLLTGEGNKLIKLGQDSLFPDVIMAKPQCVSVSYLQYGSMYIWLGASAGGLLMPRLVDSASTGRGWELPADTGSRFQIHSRSSSSNHDFYVHDVVGRCSSTAEDSLMFCSCTGISTQVNALRTLHTRFLPEPVETSGRLWSRPVGRSAN